MWDMSICSKFFVLFFLYPYRQQGTSQEFQNFFWDFHRNQNYSPSYLGFSSPCTWSLFGKLLIILAVSSDSHLQIPMYFFLSNLSFVDICFASTTIPMLQKPILEKPTTTLRESENSGLLSQQTQRS